MRKWIIGELAGSLAEQYFHNESESGPPRDVNTLEADVLADVQALIEAEVIRPRITSTDEPAPAGLPLDPSWCINHREFNHVAQYARHLDPDRKRGYIEEVTGCFRAGRYTLDEAAYAIAEGSDEQYKSVLQRLKLAVLSEQLPTYGRGRRQKYLPKEKRTHPSQVSPFGEQMFWSDINEWLEKYESRITYRFPVANFPEPAGIDTTMTTPGACAIIHEIGADEAIAAAAEAAAPPAQQAWPWQEDQIIRSTKALGYNPLALPPDDRKKSFYVKSLIRTRCAKNHPTKMRKALFDKAWERMSGSNPPTLKYAK